MNPMFKIIAGAVYMAAGAVLLIQGVRERGCVECDETVEATEPLLDARGEEIRETAGRDLDDTKSFIESIREGE